MPSRSGDQPVLLSGPWRGHNDDRVRLQDNEVENSLNVEFVGGRIRRRPGRARLAAFDILRPASIYRWNGTTMDEPGQLIDGIYNPGGTFTCLDLAGGAIYVGFPFRVAGLNISVYTANTVAATLNIAFFSRSGVVGVGSFRAATTVSDGTAVAGKTLAQSGKVSWNVSEWDAANPWTVGFPSGASLPDGYAFAADLYWIKITTSAQLSAGTTIFELNGSLITVVGSGAALDVRCAVNSLTEFVSVSGSRELIVQMDFPGPYHDAFYMKRGESRFAKVDFERSRFIPLRLPNSLKAAQPSVCSTWAVFNGWLLGNTSEGKLFRYDGQNCAALEAFQGMDAARGILGARSYLTSTPNGRFLTRYRGKLLVAGDLDAPLTFYASLDDSDLSTIPPDAPVGGPNVWPLAGVVTIPGREGDAIVGTSVIGDRYVVLTRREIWVYDDAFIRQAEGEIGCVAPQSIQRIGESLMFLSHHGVFVFDGAAAREISRPVRRILEEMVRWTRIEEAVSGHDRSRNEYWLYLPVYGRDRNQIAIVYNYAEETWRVVSGWYPWDNESRKTTGQPLDVTASAPAVSLDGREILLAGDASGGIWQENSGFDDNGLVFPAFALLKTLGHGEEVLNWRTWRIGALMDGAIYECYALRDGMLFEKEITRRLDGLTATDQYVQKRALSPTRNTWDNPGSWDADLDPYSREDALRFSFGGRARRLQVAIVLPGGIWSAGAYTEKYVSPGGLRDLQIDTEGTGGGR